jgi:hypothetical protein
MTAALCPLEHVPLKIIHPYGKKKKLQKFKRIFYIEFAKLYRTRI